MDFNFEDDLIFQMSSRDCLERLTRDYLRLHAIRLWQMECIDNSLVEDVAKCCCTFVECSQPKIRAILEKIHADTKSRVASHSSISCTADTLISVSVKIIQSGIYVAASSRLQVEVDPLLRGKDLEENIVSKLLENLPKEESASRDLENGIQMKLIYKGQIIKSQDGLLRHQLTRASVIMCCISKTEKHGASSTSAGEQFSSVRNAAQVLSGKDARPNLVSAKLQILDQNGKQIKISSKSRQNLTSALALTEQGQNLMTEGKYSDAVFVLLEADSDFKQCENSLLDMVDNYALLQLDIISCYLYLGNVDQLPDALDRIQLAEEKLNRVYGEGMSRVARIKGTPYQELAMMVKLYLMKGVAQFYAKKYQFAKENLRKAKAILEELEVDDNKLQEMVSMGFKHTESRLSLRKCQNDVTAAIDNAFKERQQKKNAQMELKREELLEKLGSTYAGDPVNFDQYKALTSMGFPKFACIVALKRFNNDIETCLRVLQDECYDEILCYPAKDGIDNGVSKIDDISLAKLLSSSKLPHDRENNKSKLHIAGALFVNNNNFEDAQLFLMCEDKVAALASMIERVHHGKNFEDEVTELERKEQRMKEKKAQDALRDVITNQEGEEYLDLDFKTEKSFIQQYLTLLESVYSHK